MFDRFRRKKEPERKEVNIKNAIAKVVDFAPLKNFIDYGINKTLINIKLKRETDIRTREAFSKMKHQTDWSKMGMFFILFMLGAVMAYILLSQYMDYSGAMKTAAECAGNLARCQATSASQVVPVISG